MTDSRIVRTVVLFLGAIALVLVGGLIALALLERSPGDVLLTALVALAGNVVGALGAVLVSTRSNEPTPVTVPDEPIQVTQVQA